MIVRRKRFYMVRGGGVGWRHPRKGGEGHCLMITWRSLREIIMPPFRKNVFSFWMLVFF